MPLLLGPLKDLGDLWAPRALGALLRASSPFYHSKKCKTKNAQFNIKRGPIGVNSYPAKCLPSHMVGYECVTYIWRTTNVSYIYINVYTHGRVTKLNLVINKNYYT